MGAESKATEGNNRPNDPNIKGGSTFDAEKNGKNTCSQIRIVTCGKWDLSPYCRPMFCLTGSRSDSCRGLTAISSPAEELSELAAKLASGMATDAEKAKLRELAAAV